MLYYIHTYTKIVLIKKKLMPFTIGLPSKPLLKVRI